MFESKKTETRKLNLNPVLMVALISPRDSHQIFYLNDMYSTFSFQSNNIKGESETFEGNVGQAIVWATLNNHRIFYTEVSIAENVHLSNAYGFSIVNE